MNCNAPPGRCSRAGGTKIFRLDPRGGPILEIDWLIMPAEFWEHAPERDDPNWLSTPTSFGLVAAHRVKS